MRNRGIIFLILLVLALALSSAVFGYDLFLFDLEKNKVLMMGTNESIFTEKMDMEKFPDYIMQTSEPDKYLVVLLPVPEEKEEENSKDWRPPTTASDDEKVPKGEIRLINIATGRTEDVVELGYHPFRIALSKDKKHFLISYKIAPKEDDFEILYYNIPEKKYAKVAAEEVINMDFSQDSTTAFILNYKENGVGSVRTYSVSPFKFKSVFTAGVYPYKVYALSSNRAALLELGGKRTTMVTKLDEGIQGRDTTEEFKGSVKFLDTEKGKVLDSVEFNPSYVWYDWYKDQNTLLIITRKMEHSFDQNWELVWFGETHFIKVTGEGIKDIKTALSWDYQYLAEKDIIYSLTEHELEVYDLKTGAKARIKTGKNIYNEEYMKDGNNYITTLNYFVNVLPEANMAVVYSNYNGIIKFFDLGSRKLLQTFKGAKMKGVYPNDYGDKASVTTNHDKTRFYILSRSRKGLSVFDEKFTELTKLDLNNERPIGMYQVKKPVLKTVLATEKGLYEVAENDLKPICQFGSKTKFIYLLQEEKRLIFFVNDEWYILDPGTLELKYHLNEFGDPNDKYTKVKKGQRRYYYIPSYFDWSEASK